MLDFKKIWPYFVQVSKNEGFSKNELPTSPIAINGGWCDYFAEAIVSVYGGDIVSSEEIVEDYKKRTEGDYPDNHSFVLLDGTYYDAECLEGVDDYLKLPFFQREIEHLNKIKKLNEDVPPGFKPHYSISSGTRGKMFTLRHYDTVTYMDEPYVTSNHVATLTGNLETSIEKAKKLLGHDNFEISVDQVGKRAAPRKIDHSIMPFGKYSGKHFDEIPLEYLCNTLNGGYLNGTSVKKEKEYVEQFLKANGCVYREELVNQHAIDNPKKYGYEEAPEPQYQWFWRTPEWVKRDEEIKKERELQKQKRASSQFIGNVGDKITVNAKLVFVKGFETPFGMSFIKKFEDEQGNMITYFGNALHTIEKGQWVELTGVVKKHDIYNGEKSTIIQRPKMKLKEGQIFKNRMQKELEIKAIIQLLEKYSGKKIQFLEATQAKLDSIERIANYVRARVKVHNPQGSGLRVRANKTMVVVDDMGGMNNSGVFAKVAHDFIGNGFKKLKNKKKIQDKTYSVLKGPLSLFVLLPSL